MTYAPGRLDSREEQLELLQQRLALLGKVMLFLSALLLLAQGSSNNFEDLRRPSYWFLVASSGFWLALFLDCRGAQRSATRLRVVEAVCVLGWVASMGIGLRLLMVDQFPNNYMGIATQDEVAQASLLILFEKAGAMVLTLVMSLALTIRAAAVPTAPRDTAALTIAAGGGLPGAMDDRTGNLRDGGRPLGWPRLRRLDPRARLDDDHDCLLRRVAGRVRAAGRGARRPEAGAVHPRL